MRLIDADKWCMHLADLQLSNTPDERDSEDVQKEMKSNYEFIGFLIKLIEKQPTAYDVDKVVEQLEAIKHTRFEVERKSNKTWNNAIDIAIDVVIAGGADEKTN